MHHSITNNCYLGDHPYLGRNRLRAPPPTTTSLTRWSDGGAPGDWVELYNPGAFPGGHFGLHLQDNDIPPLRHPGSHRGPCRGYYLLERQRSVRTRLRDAARLFLPDGTTVVDRMSGPRMPATTTAAARMGSARSPPPPPSPGRREMIAGAACDSEHHEWNRWRRTRRLVELYNPGRISRGHLGLRL